MYKVELHFAGSPLGPQLTKSIIYTEGSNSPRMAFRGKTSEAYESEYSFQWTKGIIALCYFLIKSREEYIRCSSSACYKLLGEGESIASSLDYSIAKAPRWTHDIFGSDSNGDSLLKRIVKRSNPERRRPGPVVISLNRNQLCPSSIHIFHNDIEINDSDSLLSLASEITCIFNSGKANCSRKEIRSNLSPRQFTEAFLSTCYSQLHFRAEWLPVVNSIVSSTKETLRGTVYDTEVEKWWLSIPGQIYLYTNLLLARNKVTIKRLFILSNTSPTQRISALLNAYIQEQLGIHVAVTTLEALPDKKILKSPMLSVHDSLFAASHSPYDENPTTVIETRDTHINEIKDLYDSILMDDRVSTPLSSVLSKSDISSSLIKQADSCVKHLKELSQFQSVAQILAQQNSKQLQ